jgi:sn-glycerol 3-phosphate transport system substrate-binding protein
MTISRRDLLKTTGAVAGAAAVSAVPSRSFSARAQETVKLNLWKAPHSPQDQDFWNGKLKEFTTANPTIQVDYRVTPWETWQETYTSAFAGDSPPDVSYMVDSFFPKFADAKALVDLSTIPGADLSKWQPLFDPSIWSRGTRNGIVYGLPFLASGISLVWNKKLFSDAGLDPETPPKTWDELVGWAVKLTKSDGSQWGYSIMDNTSGEMLNFVPVPIVNYGGPLTSDDDKQWLATTDGHIQGLQLQVDMIQKDKSAPPLGTFVGHDVDKAFLDGKIAMQLSYASFLGPLMKDYPDFQMGVASPPAGPVNNLSLGGVGYWMMAEKSQHKAEAWTLTEFITSAEVMTDYAKLVQLFATRLDIKPFEGNALMSAFAPTQKNYMRLPTLPFDYWGIMMPECESALTGQESAADALKNAGDAITAKLKQG